MKEIIIINIYIISWVIGIGIGILIIELREKWKAWNREEWGVPKE